MASLAGMRSAAGIKPTSSGLRPAISSTVSVCPCHRPQHSRRATVATNALGLGLGNIAVTTVLAGAAAWYLAGRDSEWQKEQEAGEREACPRCGGSGVEECMCTRWNDGDVGCSTCSKTGYMKCRSCRGGGTAVPIKVSIRKTD